MRSAGKWNRQELRGLRKLVDMQKMSVAELCITFASSMLPLCQNLARKFGGADGGENRACHGATRADRFRVYNEMRDISDCKIRCVREPNCQGVEYDGIGKRCQIWTRHVDVTLPAEGSVCLRYGTPEELQGIAPPPPAPHGMDVTTMCSKRAYVNASACSGACGASEHGYNYLGGELYHIVNVPNPGRCCLHCRQETLCNAWTWIPTGGGSNICMLRRHQEFQRQKQDGYVSGFSGFDKLVYQIKSHGRCLHDSFGSAGLESRSCESSESIRSGPSEHQQWALAVDKGQIRSKRGACMESVGEKKVKLRPCDEGSAAQRWEIDSTTGQVRDHDGRCLSAFGARLLPCSPGNAEQKWSFLNIQELPVHSLFCFSLCVPWTNEPDLLTMQLANRISIFACDEYAVYSNPVMNIGNIKSKLLDTDLHVPKCGKYKTICNTPVFQKMWQQLTQDGQFLRHGWTVKADPDAVFLPERLRAVVRGLDSELLQSHKGIFLNNCKLGLHGPLEVISRRALEVFAASMDNVKCGYAPQEDVYLQVCMQNLGVKQIDKFDQLLAEQECARDGWHQDPDWRKCESSKAAFHPFKDPDEYQQCLNRAKPGVFGNTSIG
jgi:hypothetical protein